MPVEIEIKAPIAFGHHVDPPRFLRLAVDAYEDGHGASPAGPQPRGADTTDMNVRIDANDLNRSSKFHWRSTTFHWPCAPVRFRPRGASCIRGYRSGTYGCHAACRAGTRGRGLRSLPRCRRAVRSRTPGRSGRRV